ncbi:hypothetical protein FQN57_004766 [Myotisia sp. PD_48]|nr:hypothetical protein FQN57_004766 [Myotisia sp. PD_48]
MSSVNSRPVRRRNTLLSKVRPRTSGGEHAFSQQGGRAHTGIWVPHEDGSYREAVSHFSHEIAPIPTSHHDPSLPAIDVHDGDVQAPVVSRHRHSKSFSSVRHGVNELKTIARSFSLSLRHKGNKRPIDVPQAIDEPPLTNVRSCDSKAGAGWFRSHRLPRRPSLSAIGALNRFYPPVPVQLHEPCFLIPEPPLAEELSGGAAARAAAAAQNEMVKIEKLESNKDSERDFFEMDAHFQEMKLTAKVSLDSESGIEINLQDSTDGTEDDSDFVRKDPVGALPAELMANILSFLDVDSIKNAELVSRSWNIQASSRHVWRDVFYNKYRDSRGLDKLPARGQRPMGLGARVPHRDWKKIYAVRHNLENRWKEGKAAAIYLQGHQDSVYCVQFDENKIITGSRDRTIRVWDAHYPWTCLKVIGASNTPSNGTPVSLPPITQSPDTIGKSPFVTICPPVQSSPESITKQIDADEYHQASILCLQFDDEIMVTGSSDYTCIIWDIKDDYRPIHRLRGHQAGVLDICFDDRYIVSCSKDHTICIWDRSTGALVKRLLGHKGPVNAVQLRGDLVASASGDGVAKLWNIPSGLCIKEFASRDRGLACVEFSHDARFILAGGNDQVIYQFDANTGELVHELKGHCGLVRSLYMDSANGRVVSGSYDMSVKVFDAKSGDLTIDLPGWTTSWMLGAKSDYRRIVATSQDARAVIMDFGYGLDGIELLEG